MEITALPFNQLIGLSKSEDPDYLLMLCEDDKYGNHLGTVHASALFSLAEATCAQFLLIHFPQFKNTLVPVVRTVDVKYKRPAIGQINSQATLQDATKEDVIELLSSKNRAVLSIKVELLDSNKIVVMQARFEWFVSKYSS